MDNLTSEDATTLLAAAAIAITAIFALLSVAAIWLAKKALAKFSEVTGFKVEAQQEATIIRVVRRVIAYAEEQANKLARGLIKIGPRNGREKLELAKSAARSSAPPGLLSDVSDEKLELLIEAELQSMRPATPTPLPLLSPSRFPPPSRIPGEGNPVEPLEYADTGRPPKRGPL